MDYWVVGQVNYFRNYVGQIGCRTSGLSEKWVVGQMGSRTSRSTDKVAVQQVSCRKSALLFNFVGQVIWNQKKYRELIRQGVLNMFWKVMKIRGVNI